MKSTELPTLSTCILKCLFRHRHALINSSHAMGQQQKAAHARLEFTLDEAAMPVATVGRSSDELLKHEQSTKTHGLEIFSTQRHMALL